MPVPVAVLPLPDIEGLPTFLRRMAESVIYTSPSPDHLFLLADNLTAAAEHGSTAAPLAAAALALATELRRRAPEYA